MSTCTCWAGRMALTLEPVQIADIAAHEAYRAGNPLRAVELLRARTCVWLGLFKDGALLGALTSHSPHPSFRSAKATVQPRECLNGQERLRN